MERSTRSTPGASGRLPICAPDYDPARKYQARGPAGAGVTGAARIAHGVAEYGGVAISATGIRARPAQRPTPAAPAAPDEGLQAELAAGPRGAILEELIGLLGTRAAAELVAAFGGTRLYVPHNPADEDALSAAIGYPAAVALARIYGGDRLEVPNPTPRRVRITQMRAAGQTVDAIARALGCTRRRVFQVLAEARAKQREQ